MGTLPFKKIPSLYKRRKVKEYMCGNLQPMQRLSSESGNRKT